MMLVAKAEKYFSAFVLHEVNNIMNFSEVEKWVIPEGEVYQVSDADNVILWRKKFNLSLTSNPSDGGTCLTPGKYYWNQDVTVNAVPNSNYQFLSWSDGKAQSHNVNMTGDIALTANFRLMLSKVTFHDNQPCNVIYEVKTFGCTPTLKTTINGTLVDQTTTNFGDNTIVIKTSTGLNATLQITDIPDDCMIYIKGTKTDSKTYDYVTEDGVVSQLQIFIIQKEHLFKSIKSKIPYDKFIYSPGTLIGGLKYRVHWQSQDSADLEKELPEYGRISLGHVGGASHKMHLIFAYQVNNSQYQYITTGIKNGNNKTGYYTINDEGKEVWHYASNIEDVEILGVTNLSQASTQFNVRDGIIDLKKYSHTDTIRIGIILRDNTTGCTGIYFGRTDNTTKCTIEIIDD